MRIDVSLYGLKSKWKSDIITVYGRTLNHPTLNHATLREMVVEMHSQNWKQKLRPKKQNVDLTEHGLTILGQIYALSD